MYAKIMRVLLAMALAGGIVTANASTLDVGTWSGSGCCSGGTRGYWFEATLDFTIDRIYLPNAKVSSSTLQILEFASAPPTYGSSTNDFVSLGYWTNQQSVATSISVHAGDLIGVLGWADGSSPYGITLGDYATTLGGSAISLQRLGFQSVGSAANVWREAGGNIGVIGLDYTIAGNNVPEPASLALAGIALAGLGVVRRRKQAQA